MAKSKSQRHKISSANKAKPKKGNSLWLKLTIPLIIAVIIGGYGLHKFLSKGLNEGSLDKKEDLSLYQLKEKRPTLLPALFQGRAAEAYQAAAQFPKVLDQVHCYCYCEENFGHKSLLSCFVDKHGAT